MSADTEVDFFENLLPQILVSKLEGLILFVGSREEVFHILIVVFYLRQISVYLFFLEDNSTIYITQYPMELINLQV